MTEEELRKKKLVDSANKSAYEASKSARQAKESADVTYFLGMLGIKGDKI